MSLVATGLKTECGFIISRLLYLERFSKQFQCHKFVALLRVAALTFRVLTQCALSPPAVSGALSAARTSTRGRAERCHGREAEA